MLSRLLGFLAAIASVAPALANATTPANGIPSARDVPLMKRYEGVQLAKVSRHAPPSLSLPQTIYLMRHADKPAVAKDPDLSAAGVVRAGRLSGYFPSLLGNSQPLNYIFAAKASKVSNRSVETATPLAESLHLPINQSYANSSYRALAKAIRSSGSYGGKTILIVWHHGTLPALARALGAVDVPQKWPGTSFNLIWKLTYNADGGASLQQITEPF